MPLHIARQANKQLGTRPKSRWPAKVQRALDKANQYSCYLGLDDYAWLDLLH